MGKGIVTGIFSAKSGTGKTIFTLNIGGVSALNDKKTLIIDLNFYNSDIGMCLNKQVKKDLYNFCDDYANNRYKDIEDYIVKYSDNLDFISAPKDPRKANKINKKYLDILIDKCLYKYDYIFIDMSSILDEINVFVLDKVEKILFLTTNNVLDLKNLKNVLTILKENDINKYKVILNNSVCKNNNSFSLYDVKTIIDNNVDYIISDKFYIKNIDEYIYNGKIYAFENNNFKDLKIFNLIINDLGKVKDE